MRVRLFSVDFSFLNDYYETKAYKDRQLTHSSAEHEYGSRRASPIEAYNTIKRLSVDWNKIVLHFREPDWMEIEKLMVESNDTFPRPSDLVDAGEALTVIQKTYRLNITDMAKGVIKGHKAKAQLTPRDCLYFGQLLYNQYDFEPAIKWFEEALTRLSLEKQPSVTPETVHGYLDSSLLQNATEEKDLRCYLSVPHPYFRIGPVKMEVMSLDPYIVQFYDVIWPEEIRAIRNLGEPMLSRATVREAVEQMVSHGRISQVAWLRPDTDPLLERVNERVAMLTGLSTDYEGGDSEILQALRIHPCSSRLRRRHVQAPSSTVLGLGTLRSSNGSRQGMPCPARPRWPARTPLAIHVRRSHVRTASSTATSVPDERCWAQLRCSRSGTGGTRVSQRLEHWQQEPCFLGRPRPRPAPRSSAPCHGRLARQVLSPRSPQDLGTAVRLARTLRARLVPPCSCTRSLLLPGAWVAAPIF
ncbi:hypothetical protein HPB49_020210 [Dermacentor silvarum]|uniref:Uncharacterized protein n=1 Tax=Dermacentor silvarum TaxID=543639 RepID=A0ACB8CT95_DERSI|nr:hypothetical protein HPB49_020210 [Dermacentor silvarum]